jgi:hypothetical protein
VIDGIEQLCAWPSRTERSDLDVLHVPYPRTTVAISDANQATRNLTARNDP